MTPEESKELTARLEKAALLLLSLDSYRKKEVIADRDLTLKQAKTIRKATQTLEGWEKVKRYRPECGAKLANGRRCKLSVVIRQPEGWDQGCLADRCRMHGGSSRRIRKKKVEDDET